MSDEREVKARLHQADLDATNDLRKERYSQEASAIRSLQLVNAGGAVALLAFLGQIWTKAASLQIPLAVSIGLMILGLLLAVWAEFQLPGFIEARWDKDRFPDTYRRAKRRRNWTIGPSFAAFLLSVLFLLITVAHNHYSQNSIVR